MNQKSKTGIFAASGLYLLAAGGLLVIALAALPLDGLLKQMWPDVSYEWSNLILNAVYYLPFLLLPAVLWATRRDDGIDRLRLNPISLGTTFQLVILAMVAMLLIYDGSLFWMALLQKLGFNVFTDVYVRPETSAELARSIIGAALIAPVCEELLFRGVMLSCWESQGTKKAVFVTAALFSVMHGSLTGLPGQFFGGMLMALLVIWTGSIYAGMIFHGAYNAANLLLNYVSTGVEVEEAAEIEALMETDLLGAMGGFPAVLSTLMEMAFLILMVIVITRSLRIFYAFRRSGVQVAENGKLILNPEEADKIRESLRAMARDRKNRGFIPDEMPPEGPMPMSVGDKVMTALCLAPVAVLYVFDFMLMLGGIA